MIRIWKAPSVSVLAMSSLCEPKGSDFAAWRSNDTGFNSALDLIPEVAGRVCYMSFGKGRPTNKEYIANILEQQHESVLEHSVVTFGLQGISRTCSHELVRHRHLSYSQLSQRYVGGEAACSDYVLPVSWVDAEEDFYAMCSLFKSQYMREYKWAQERGLKGKELAQAVRPYLPGCTETKIVVTGNLRAWRHFCKLRGSVHADPEIRWVACVILRELKHLAPHVFEDLEAANGQVREVGAA